MDLDAISTRSQAEISNILPVSSLLCEKPFDDDESIFTLKDKITSLLEKCDVLRAVSVPFPFSSIELIVTDLTQGQAVVEEALAQKLPYAISYRVDPTYALQNMSEQYG